jgi:hypothetical protein
MSNGAPDVGSTWLWTHPYQPIIEDVPVTVTEITDTGSVLVQIEDEEIIERDKRDAESTYQDNGHNMDNVKEVHPFVTDRSNGEMKTTDQWLFVLQKEFYEQCVPKNN